MTDNSQRFKKGDRVRYTGGYDPSLSRPEARGRLGTVDEDSGGNVTNVTWDISDIHRPSFNVFNGNIELAAPAIDTTKPIVAGSYGALATFVTETSDGHILVSVRRANGWNTDGWVIIDKQGKFVRSSDSMGDGLLFKNKAIATSEYVAVAKDGTMIHRESEPYRNRGLAWDSNPDAGHLIQIDKLDGVVTGVGILKRPA